MRFTQFIQSSQEVFRALFVQRTLNHALFESISLVIGNESADLDSLSGSLALAYLRSYEENGGAQQAEALRLETAKRLYLPLMNCRRAEIISRFEFVHVAQKNGLSAESLNFVDDFDLQKAVAEFHNVEVVLYDHNVPSASQQFLRKHVTAIVDHHDDQTAACYDAGQLRSVDIRKVGSAQTMLALYFQQRAQQLLEKQLALFMLSTILIDTQGFEPKLFANRWVDDDRTAFEFLRSSHFADEGAAEAAARYRELEDVKFDAKMNTDLGLQQLLVKDYKSFEYKAGRFGYSVFLVSFDSLFAAFGEDGLAQQIAQFVAQQGLAGLFLLHCYKNANGPQLDREFLLLLGDAPSAQQLTAKIESSLDVTQKEIPVPAWRDAGHRR